MTFKFPRLRTADLDASFRHFLFSSGPLASAIITWRNSLVFHSLDKVTSLFIHICSSFRLRPAHFSSWAHLSSISFDRTDPPFTFTVILHYYPGREQRWPAINRMNEINWFQSIMLGVGFCESSFLPSCSSCNIELTGFYFDFPSFQTSSGRRCTGDSSSSEDAKRSLQASGRPPSSSAFCSLCLPPSSKRR